MWVHDQFWGKEGGIQTIFWKFEVIDLLIKLVIGVFLKKLQFNFVLILRLVYVLNTTYLLTLLRDSSYFALLMEFCMALIEKKVILK